MIERLGAQMAAAANPAKAAGMQAYMKSTMPYHGVNLPAVRSISRKAFDRSAMSCAEWQATILELRPSIPPSLFRPGGFLTLLG